MDFGPYFCRNQLKLPQNMNAAEGGYVHRYSEITFCAYSKLSDRAESHNHWCPRGSKQLELMGGSWGAEESRDLCRKTTSLFLGPLPYVTTSTQHYFPP